MTHNDSQKALLVHFAVREVGPKGSLEEMKCVCYCLRNRVRAGWGDWMEVIEHADQAAAHADDLGQRIYLDPQSRAYQMLLQAVDDIYYAQPRAETWDGQPVDQDAQGETLESAVGTAMYWRFLRRPLRVWFQENVVNEKQEHPERATMGLMVLYK
jgi:hypothetical protein